MKLICLGLLIIFAVMIGLLLLAFTAQQSNAKGDLAFHDETNDMMFDWDTTMLILASVAIGALLILIGLWKS